MIIFFLILLLGLLPFCYSDCYARANEIKYENCQYENNLPDPFFNVENFNANISYCSFKHITDKQFFGGRRLQTFVEHSACLNLLLGYSLF
jgi:hypothetical protein